MSAQCVNSRVLLSAQMFISKIFFCGYVSNFWNLTQMGTHSRFKLLRDFLFYVHSAHTDPQIFLASPEKARHLSMTPWTQEQDVKLKLVCGPYNLIKRTKQSVNENQNIQNESRNTVSWNLIRLEHTWYKLNIFLWPIRNPVAGDIHPTGCMVHTHELVYLKSTIVI